MAKSKLGTWSTSTWLGSRWLGKIYRLRFSCSSTGAREPTKIDAESRCLKCCSAHAWFRGDGIHREHTTGPNATTDHLRGVLRDQWPATLQANSCWWDGRVWIMVGVSPLCAVVLCLPEGLADWMKLTNGHSVQSICIQLQKNFKWWNFPLTQLLQKRLTPASDPLHLLRVYISRVH